MSFLVCLPIILQSEGGFVDNPDDPGGATNHGITLATYSAFLGKPASVVDLKLIDSQTVAALYLNNYWNPAGCDLCPPGPDLMVFDAAVNSGVRRSVEWLQQAVGVSADGVIGPATRAAIADCKPSATITLLQNLRATFLRSLSDFDAFGDGWISRVERTAKLAQAMCLGAP